MCEARPIPESAFRQFAAVQREAVPVAGVLSEARRGKVLNASRLAAGNRPKLLARSRLPVWDPASLDQPTLIDRRHTIARRQFDRQWGMIDLAQCLPSR
jgi:hypothetical protein